MKNVENFLNENWDAEATKEVVVSLREQAKQDEIAKVDGNVPIPNEVSFIVFDKFRVIIRLSRVLKTKLQPNSNKNNNNLEIHLFIYLNSLIYFI